MVGLGWGGPNGVGVGIVTENAAEERAGGRQHFLFLQGPHGSFFPLLGAALRAAGHQVDRVNLNGGDAATWPGGINYAGTPRGWPPFVRRLLRRRQISDLVVYGDARPMHAAAIDVARAAGVRIHVFEEGYLRPDWVTLERDGVNGNSRLARDPAWYRQEARLLVPLPASSPVPKLGGMREWAAFFYSIEVVLNHWRFPFHQSHRTLNPAIEAATYLRRWLTRRRDDRAAAAAMTRLREARFYLFPLQLSTDFQIRRHSPFGTMVAAVRHVLGSFARHAPPGTLLAIKEHPLDYGGGDWRSTIAELAAAMGLADRVVFLRGGDLDELVGRSLGVVTVNSTSGTLALEAGKPVKVLGHAVYDLPDLTDQRPLDSFWRDPLPPDAATYDAFCRVLGDRCLLPGAFLSRADGDALIAAAAERLAEASRETVAGPA